MFSYYICQRCAEGAREVRGRCTEGARKVHGRCAGGAQEVHGRCAGGARKVRGRCTEGKKCCVLIKFLDYFSDKMVDISTWRCRIGTFSQKSKKVFHVLKSEGKKVIVTSCYFSCFVVSLDLGFNLFI